MTLLLILYEQARWILDFLPSFQDFINRPHTAPLASIHSQKIRKEQYFMLFQPIRIGFF